MGAADSRSDLMDFGPWEFLLTDPAAWGSFLAAQLGVGLAIGAAALALSLLIRR